jgi:hypothetical protein
MPVPDFSPGEVLTAAAMDSIGLWLVKTQTIASGVSTVTVTGAFSADYENYLIILDNVVISSASGFPFTLGATATGYYWAGTTVFYSSGSTTTEFGSNATVFASGVVTDSTGPSGAQITLYRPFSATKTNYNAHGSDSRIAGAGVRTYSGVLNNTTSYTSLTFATTAGTVTSGTIRVYGYRN